MSELPLHPFGSIWTAYIYLSSQYRTPFVPICARQKGHKTLQINLHTSFATDSGVFLALTLVLFSVHYGAFIYT